MKTPDSGLRKGLFVIALLLVGFGAYHYWTTRLGGYLPLPWLDRPIIAAAKSCDVDRVGRILARSPRAIWTRVKKNRATPLHWAARKCGPRVVKLLLDKGASLTSRTRTGAMPLHWAAAWGKADTVRLLLDRGAWLEARTYAGASPLHWAAWRGSPAVVKLLLARGANRHVYDRRGRTPESYARRAHRTAVVRLLTSPARPPAVSPPKAPAVTTGKPKPKQPPQPKPTAKPAPKPTAKPMPAPKPKPGAKPTPKPTAGPAAGQELIKAVRAGDRALVGRILARSPAAVKAVDPAEGGTALHWAARLGKTEIVLLLIEHRADRRAKDKKGLTPFDWAVKAKHPDIAALLSTGK